jgi:hypothetical protein
MRSSVARERLRRAALCAFVIFAAGVSAASAQGTDPLEELIRRSIEIDERNFRNPVFRAVIRSVDPLVTAPTAGEFFQHLVALHTSTFPVPTSAGAFTYAFNPVTRTFARRASSLGPTFLDRATTIGRARAWTLGWSYQPLKFHSLDGVRLSDSPLYMAFSYPDGREARRTLSVELETHTHAFFGSFALSRDLDLTVVAPVSRISYRGTVTGENGGGFDTGRATSTGLGDVETRLKWSAWRTSRFDIGARYALRLPTGKDAIHSLERAQQKLAGLVSTRLGPVVAHVNAGYTFRVAGESPGAARTSAQLSGFLRQGSLSNEVDYRFGAEWAARSRLTLTADFVGRHVKDTIRFDPVRDDFTQPDPFDPDAPFGFYRTSMRPVATDMHVALAAGGAKYQMVGQTLLAFQVLFPLSSGGLKPGISTTIGWEFGF